jgi:hypothetical protein
VPIAARLPKCKHRSVEEEVAAAAARPLPRAGGCGSRKDLALLAFFPRGAATQKCVWWRYKQIASGEEDQFFFAERLFTIFAAGSESRE